MASTAKITKKNPRIAEQNDLYSVNWVQSQLVGAQKLKSGTRPYLWYLLALVKRGYETIAAPQRTIADACHRATGGNKSIRSLQYALNELEENEFITRRKYRIGDDHFRSVILINREAFSFWTRVKTKNVTPMPTRTHISTYAHDVRKDNVREITPCKSTHSSDNNYNTLAARARCKTSAKQFKFHPIIFSLLTVLFGRNIRRWPTVYPSAVQLAHAEISGETDRTEIRWGRWESEWQRMPISEREGICRTSFLPRLQSHSQKFDRSKITPMKATSPPKPKPPRAKPADLPPVLATPDHVRTLLSNAAFYERPTEKEKPTVKNNLGEDELAILSRTRERLKNR